MLGYSVATCSVYTMGAVLRNRLRVLYGIALRLLRENNLVSKAGSGRGRMCKAALKCDVGDHGSACNGVRHDFSSGTADISSGEQQRLIVPYRLAIPSFSPEE